MVQKQALTGGLREGPWGCSLFYWAGALHRSRVKRGYALLRYPPTTKPLGLPEMTVEGKTKAFISLCRKKSVIGAEEKVWVNSVTRLFLLQWGAYHPPHLQFQFLCAGEQIYNCTILNKCSLPCLLLQMSIYVLRRQQPRASRQSHFPV